MKRWLFLFTFFFLFLGCANTQMTLKRSPNAQVHQTTEFRTHAFLLGTIPLNRLAEREIGQCPTDQITSLRVYMNTWDVVFTFATALLYTPHHVEITCTKLDSTSVPKP